MGCGVARVGAAHGGGDGVARGWMPRAVVGNEGVDDGCCPLWWAAGLLGAYAASSGGLRGAGGDVAKSGGLRGRWGWTLQKAVGCGDDGVDEDHLYARLLSSKGVILSSMTWQMPCKLF